MIIVLLYVLLTAVHGVINDDDDDEMQLTDQNKIRTVVIKGYISGRLLHILELHATEKHWRC